MLRAGLTGSIAVGKSFVSSVLAELGCHVLDADQTAREVVAPGSVGLRAVADAFGSETLRPDGTLDRTKLGAIVFSDETKRERLNAILHPLIIAAQDAWMERWAAQDARGVGIVDAALMIETGSYRRFDKLIVVYCRPELQLERLVKRDGLTPAEAGRRIAAQMPQEEKKSFADYLIDTSGGFAETREQAVAVYEHLKMLAAENFTPSPDR
ncbi:MAG TPA: dephospho-CoA kinase [Pyrinomonadaceae bacterium]|nr:dephospho-CoA kinase [Pyrinomonadaceae bacterium]